MSIGQMVVRRHVWLSVLLLVSLPAGTGAQVQDTPLPIRRIEVEPGALGPEMRRDQVLVPMPRAQFEELVGKARRIAAAEKQQPQLLAAHYHAHLDEESLVGTADWTLHNPSPVTGVFRLQPWNLALQAGSHLDGQAAVLGELASGAIGLVLPASARSRVHLSWSARAELRPEGLWYFLQTPAASVAVLDIDAPMDREVECPGHKAYAIPVSQGDSAKGTRRWRITFGATKPADLEVLVRPTRATSKPGLVWAASATTCTLTPASCEVRFLIDLRLAHQRLSQVQLELEPALELVDIVPLRTPQLAWRRQASSDKSRSILVTFAEPVERQTTLEVRCRADELVRQPAGTRVRMPGLRVLGALPGQETLRVRVGQGVRLTQWDLAGFRLQAPIVVEREGGETFESYHLLGAGPAGVVPHRPSARIQPALGELTASQEVWWQIGTETSTLTVLTNWHAVSGRAFMLSTSVPAGWRVEDAELVDSDLKVTWHAGEGPSLVAEIQEGLDSRTPVRTRVYLRSMAPVLPGVQQASLPLPRVIPVGCRLQESSFAVSVPESFALPQSAGALIPARFRNLNGRVQPVPAAGDHAWSADPRPPDLYCRNYGEAISGFLDLEPAGPSARTTARTEIIHEDNEVSIAYFLLVEPLAGMAATVQVQFNVPTGVLDWNLQGQEAELFEQPRLISEKSNGDLAAWELKFRQPLRGPVRLTGRRKVKIREDEDIPLPVVTAGRAMVLLNDGAATPLGVEQAGLHPAAAASGFKRVWTYGTGAVRMRLLEPGRDPALLIPTPTAEYSIVTFGVSGNGPRTHVFRSWLRSPTADAVVLDLPVNVRVESVRVRGALLPEATGRSLVIPIAEGMNPVEVVYSEPASWWRLGSLLTVEFPRWQPPVQQFEPRSSVALPPEVALWSFGLGHRPPGPVMPAPWKYLRSFVTPHQKLAEDAGARMLRDTLASWDQLADRAHGEPLGDSLRRLEMAGNEGTSVFVIDAAGLAERGVDLATRVPANGRQPPWETPGLIVVPCEHALLVTTRKRLADWRLGSELEAARALSRPVEDALAFGHDASGQFHSLVEATRSSPAVAVQAEAPGSWITHDLGSCRAGTRLLLVDRSVISLLAGAMAGAVLLTGWYARGRRSVVACGFFLLGCLMLLWVPEAFRVMAWCLLGAAGILGATSQLHSVRDRRRPGRSSMRNAAAAVLLPAVVAIQGLQAQPTLDPLGPVSDTVYILRDRSRRAEEAEVLVPRALLTRLQELAGRTAVGLPAYALLDADYRAEIENVGARVHATYSIQVFGDQPVEVELALGNIRLVQALLDSAPALVGPLGPEGGLKLRIEGRGRHALSLTWDSPLQDADGEFRLNCPIPPVAASRLTLKLPKGALSVRAPGARGALWRQSSPGNPQLVVDLGRVSELRVRWQTNPRSQKALSTRGAYLLDLGADRIALRGAVQFESSQGTVNHLRFDLPACLEVTSLEARGETVQDSAQRLKDWRVESSGARRTLVVELARPVAGKGMLLLEFALHSIETGPTASWLKLGVLPLGPANALAPALGLADLEWATCSQRTLRFALPTPVGAERTETLLAYRLDGVTADLPALSRGLAVTDEWQAFKKAWPTEFGGTDGLQHVLSGRGLVAPHLHLRVADAAPKLEVSQAITLTPDGAGIDFRGQVAVIPQSGRLAHISLRVPNDLELTEVTGADVYRWDRHGTEHQVWLTRSVSDRTVLECKGRLLTRTEESGEEWLQLPHLQLPDAQSVKTVIEINLNGTATAEAERLDGIAAAPGPGTLTLTAQRPDYTGSVRIRPAPQPRAAPQPMRGATPGSVAATRTGPPCCRVLGLVRTSQLSDWRWQRDLTEIFVAPEPGACLKALLAADTQIQEVVCDGQVLGNCRRRENVLLIPLPSGRVACRILVRSCRPLEIPLAGDVMLAGIRPEADGDYPVAWEVRLPPGASTESASLRKGALASAIHALNRAQMCHRLMEAGVPAAREEVSPRTDDILLSVETAFLRHAADAAHRFRLARAAADSLASKKLASLRKQNQQLPRDERWNSIRQEAEEIGAAGPDRNCRASAGGGPGGISCYQVLSRDEPSLRFEIRSTLHQERQTALLLSFLVMGMAAVLLPLARLGHGLHYVSAFWSEMMVGFGVAAYAGGIGETGPLVLVTVGVLTRGLALLHGWLKLPALWFLTFAAPAVAPGPAAAAHGSDATTGEAAPS